MPQNEASLHQNIKIIKLMKFNIKQKFNLSLTFRPLMLRSRSFLGSK